MRARRRAPSEPAIIVADSRRDERVALSLDRDVGSLGEYRVEMPLDQYRGPVARALTLGDDVADFIDAHVAQPDPLEALLELGGTHRLLERRRRNLRQLDLLLQRPCVVVLDDVERRANLGVRRRNCELLRRERRRDERAKRARRAKFDLWSSGKRTARLRRREGGVDLAEMHGRRLEPGDHLHASE